MLNVYFTVDTEASMGGAWQEPGRRPVKADRHIFCRINGRDHGIGLICDALSRYGFRATFFVETLMTLVNGEEDVRSVFDFLIARDQDVQLHLHPTYRFYADVLRARENGRAYQPPASNDLLGGFDESTQLSLIFEAASLFEQFARRRPVAFRAGCFAASRTTLKCLHGAGIVADSSFNPCYPRWSFSNEGLTPNRVTDAGGIWEIPVTVARTPLPEGCSGLKHADPCALSVRELRRMLEYGAAQGQEHFVIVFHSFSAVKARDVTYSRLKPDKLTIHRLHRLLKYLRSRPDLYRVSTFGEMVREQAFRRPGTAPLAELPFAAAGVRKSLQAVNRLYWV